MIKSKRIEKYGQDVANAYALIASYRWNETFVCSNCNGESFFEGKFPYSRRCLKCKKDTSPTAATIFHGIHFPLPIALYIIKQLIELEIKPTSQELVDDIFRQFNHKIRDKTVWAFIIKIFKAMKIPEFEFSSFHSYEYFDVGNQRILSVFGYFNGNLRRYAIAEDKSNGKDSKIKSFLEKYKSELANFSGGHNTTKKYVPVVGYGTGHYQSYLNFECFIYNNRVAKSRYDQLMETLINQTMS